jgi:uracil-DNA glycosylase
MKNEWMDEALTEFEKETMREILKKLDIKVQAGEVIYPSPQSIFRAFCSAAQARVVILGQDPYHGPNQANGFAFAVNRGVSRPPSLRNIFKELKDDIEDHQTDETLESWAEQGVILLNSVLTVTQGKPGSHKDLGWQKITDRYIKHLSDSREHLVFILWGKFAQEKSPLIDADKHCIIKSAHPSPLSAYAGFFGSKPFSRANEYLTQHNIQPIIW